MDGVAEIRARPADYEMYGPLFTRIDPFYALVGVCELMHTKLPADVFLTCLSSICGDNPAIKNFVDWLKRDPNPEVIIEPISDDEIVRKSQAPSWPKSPVPCCHTATNTD